MRKCFLCFRPPPTLEIDEGVDCSADRMLSLFATARYKKPKKEKKSPSDSDRRSSSRKSFSSVVKAVMFQTSLSRRVRDARSRSRSDQSVESQPSTPDQTAATVEKSAFAINLKSASEQTTNTSLVVPENNERGMAEMMMNPVVCLVLLSLCVTVFCGRICAVMLTTVWIYAWQSGAVVVGLGKIVKRLMGSRRRRKKKLKAKKMRSVEGESEKVTDTVTAKGNQLIERGCVS